MLSLPGQISTASFYMYNQKAYVKILLLLNNLYVCRLMILIKRICVCTVTTSSDFLAVLILSLTALVQTI